MNLKTENQLPCLEASPLWQRGDKRGVALERGSEGALRVEGVRGKLKTENSELGRSLSFRERVRVRVGQLRFPHSPIHRFLTHCSLFIAVLLFSSLPAWAALMGGSIQGTPLNLTSSNAVVTTFAGSAGLIGSADGIGVAGRFKYPRHLATDGTNLFVVDNANSTIRKIVIATGEVVTLAGSAGTIGTSDGTGASARFYNPHGLTTDGINLFVADTYNHAIRKVVISTGAVTTIAGSASNPGSADGTDSTARFNYPNGITTDGANLFVADTDNHTIRKIVISTGEVTTIAGSAINYGSSDGIGSVARFYSPPDITTDGMNLFVPDSYNHTIRKIVISTGEVTTIAGSAGISGSTDGTGSSARFNHPSSITTDGTNLFVTDSDNHIIRKVAISTGEVSTIAGSVGISGSIDDTGSAARFYAPDGINTDGINVYVADTFNHTIRRIAVAASDTTAPTGSISINSGAASTNSTSATLTLSCTDASGCSQMQFSNDNTNWSTAEAYAASKAWTLTSGDGTKTVYVKFKDTAGNWSTPYSANITLDTTAPTTTATPAGGTYTSAQSVTLTCSDGTGSGCDKIYYTTDGTTPTTASTVYSTAISISSTTTLKFFAKDLAGNSEGVKTEGYTINTDTTSPTGAISINSGAASTNSTTATLTLSCTDSSGCSQMQFSNDNSSWSTPEPIRTSKPNWILSSGDGTKTVFVKFKDSAGNWSGAYSDTIVLDTTPIFTLSLPSQVPYFGTTGVSPLAGEYGGTYTFKTVITARTPSITPAYVRVYLNGTEVYLFGEMALDAGAPASLRDGDYMNGEQYVFTTTRYADTSYYFETSDGINGTRLPSSGYFSGVVGRDPSAPAIGLLNIFSVHTPLPDGEIDVAYSHAMIDGLCTYTLSVGPGLPPGLTIDACGIISGTPTAVGAYAFSVTAIKDQFESDYKVFSIVIVPDTTAPTTTASPAGGAYTSAQSVTLTCSDGTGSGCDKIYYTTDGSTPTTLSTVHTTPITVSSTTTLKFFAKDLAGNSETVKTEAYTIDTTAPTGTISINSGAASTNSTSSTLTLSCTDASGCAQMQFSNDNSSWSTPETYGTLKTWTLSSGDGTKTVYVKFKDTAGNWSGAYSDTITLTTVDTTPPSKPANIDVSQNGVKGELLISWSNPSDADFNHIHIYRSTASGTLGTLIADNVTGIKYTDTGLASLTTYYYTVKAVDNAGNESTNTNAQPNEYGLSPRATTLDATPPAVPSNVTAVDATTGGKINLSWTNPTDSDFAQIKVYRSTASGTLGSAVFIGLATTYSDTGLTNGTTYYYTVRALDTSSNETTNTAQVSATPTAPDATPPAVPATGGTPVVDTQAGGMLTITWTNPIDLDFAFVRIYRSTSSGVLGTLVYDNVTGTSKTDTGLTNNATYYYTIRSVDTAGNESTNTNQSSGMPTDIQVPMKVTGLTASLLSNGQIKLDWTRSASSDVNAYNIYSDNGTGTIDYTYANKIGTVGHPTTTWTSGNLTVGTAYKFAVRAEDSAQNEEPSISVVASAVPVTNPNAGDVKGYIKVPQTGQKINGNRVTVVADLLTGASIDVKDMRLQYKPASSGSWTDITPADPSFPNPDTTNPWFTHWDVTSLATGDYLIRGIATNVNLTVDSSPSYITVTVSNISPEVTESVNQKTQDVSANTANKVSMGTDSGVTQVTISEGALSTDTKVNVTAPAPATKDSLVPAGTGKANEYREITLDSGQTSLSNDKTADIVIPYKDDNNDGIVDSTATKVYDLKVMRYNTTTSQWEKLDSVVDTTNKTVKGKTNHFTLFGLLAPPNPTAPGWNIVAVPLQPSPNSASSVFGQTPYVYNPTTNGYDRPSTIQPGVGYWIKGGANLTATGTETSTAGNFSISIKKGWNMIGNPFRFNVNLSDCKVLYNAVEYTMAQAETNGYLIGTVYPYINGVYQFINASDGGKLEPWIGYWILSDKDMTLLVPPTPAQ